PAPHASVRDSHKNSIRPHFKSRLRSCASFKSNPDPPSSHLQIFSESAPLKLTPICFDPSGSIRPVFDLAAQFINCKTVEFVCLQQAPGCRRTYRHNSFRSYNMKTFYQAFSFTRRHLRMAAACLAALVLFFAALVWRL